MATRGRMRGRSSPTSGRGDSFLSRCGSDRKPQGRSKAGQSCNVVHCPGKYLSRPTSKGTNNVEVGFLEILLLPLLLPAINPLSYRHRITACDSYVRVLRHALNGVISTSIVVRQPVNQPENDAACQVQGQKVRMDEEN